jgi:Ca2+-binding EF-hand superfamily protein
MSHNWIKNNSKK